MYTTEVKQLFTIFVALWFLSNIDYKIWFLNDTQSSLLMQVAIFVILINYVLIKIRLLLFLF